MTVADWLGTIAATLIAAAWCLYLAQGMGQATSRCRFAYAAGMTVAAVWATTVAIETGDGWPRLAAALWMLAAFAAAAIAAARNQRTHP